jgi:hypothetical protein
MQDVYPTTHMNYKTFSMSAHELTAAGTLVLTVHANDPHMLSAINRATLMLRCARWRVDGGILKVESSKGGDTFYHADADSCDCPAFTFCWHRAGWLLLSAIAAVRHEIPPMRGEPLTLMEAQALVDELI